MLVLLQVITICFTFYCAIILDHEQPAKMFKFKTYNTFHSSLSYVIFPICNANICCRSAPPLALLLLFYCTCMDLICEGPLCPEFYSAVIKPCVSNWWATITYTANYATPQNTVGITRI